MGESLWRYSTQEEGCTESFIHCSIHKMVSRQQIRDHHRGGLPHTCWLQSTQALHLLGVIQSSAGFFTPRSSPVSYGSAPLLMSDLSRLLPAAE